MSAKHTPGPWAARAFPAYGYGITAEDSPQARESFAVVHFADTSRGRTAERARGDALLIAAAPDLLAALLDIVAIDDGDISALWPYCDLFDNARDAIAKAVGEPAFNGASAKTMKATGEAA